MRFSARIFVLLMCSVLARYALAEPSLAEVTANLEEIEKRPAGSPARDSGLSLWQQAKSSLETAAAHRADAARSAQILDTAPGILRRLQNELARVTRAAGAVHPEAERLAMSAVELQRAMETALNERSALETRLNAIDQRARSLAARPAEISQLKSEAAGRIAAIELELGEVQGVETSEILKARRASLEAEFAARQAELDALNAEQMSHGVSVEMNELERRITDARLSTVAGNVSFFETRLLELRTAELKRIQEDAGRALEEATQAPPTIRRLAADNVRFGKLLSDMLDEQALAVDMRTRYSRARRELGMAFDRARQRVQLAGSSANLGRLLVDQRRELPEARALERAAHQSAEKLALVGLQRIEIDEQLLAAREALAPTERLGDEAALDAASASRAAGLLKDQIELLERLDETQTSARRALDAADFELQQYVGVVGDFRTFLDERLLWLPNAATVSPQFFRELVAAVEWSAHAAIWQQLATDLYQGARLGGLPVLALGLCAVFAYRARRGLRHRRAALAAQASAPASDRLRNAIFSLLVAGALALPAPLLLLAVSRLLLSAFTSAEFSVAVGQVVASMAWLMWGMRTVSEMLAPDGVTVAHFGWPAVAVRAVRRRWVQLMWVFVPAYAIASNFEWSGNPAFYASLRRLAFMLAMAAFAGFLIWALRRQGVLQQTLSTGPRAFVLSSWWRACAVAAWVTPVLLCVLSVLGYQYAALALSAYGLQTAVLVLAAVVTYQLALRWLTLAQSTMSPELDADAHGSADTQEAGRRSPTYTPDLATMSAQSRLIFRNLVGWSAAVGLFGIWREVLPALGALEQVTLWEVQVKDGTGILHGAPITLASAVLAGLIATVSVLAARNMPSLLEIAVLRRFPMHRGSRYAVNMLVRYVIAAVGFSLTLSTLGLRWSQVQWLVAALGVGLGFGLQEIFANFISGLILLFERPIRVGDFVTIGDLSGRVARIQIRATTIADADNREIIVPNRNFITERFVNWTLTDSVTRLVIPVGIAYGTNVEKALGLLLGIANAHEKVLCEPAPGAVFQSFGDSALLIELQVYAREMPHRLDLRHELNRRIYEVFTAEGIEIPFPQRDVHVRTMPATGGTPEAA